ncbi:MAG: DegT/DnrJ/EryC1/StrS aminotransferase family protein [Chlorobium sp.]|nr:DegT/DnrJ/EryC1/StrS aminotransferase family protein [Chlorobium sp.]
MINKLANNENRFNRKMYNYCNARSAFKAYMGSLNFEGNDHVLLPAYIGWSSREGSGVFDPVKELGIKYAFYKFDKNLCIDIDNFKLALDSNKIKLIVIIHYFGFIDPNYNTLMSIAKSKGIPVLEDEAHALYTDLIGGISGRLGDAVIFSMHKMLPVISGGLLCVNTPHSNNDLTGMVDKPCASIQEYDLKAIADSRLRNTEALQKCIEPYADIIKPLRRHLAQGEIPQTFPVLIEHVSRDKIYNMMNESGFGVVSLYHTMIDAIQIEMFPESFFVSKHILNLPVHQDAEPGMMKSMVEQLLKAISVLEIENKPS